MLGAKPWKFEGIIFFLILLFGILGLTNVLLAFYHPPVVGQAPSERSGFLLIQTVLLNATVLGLVVWFLRRHQTTWAEAFGLKQQPWRSVGWGVGGAVVAIPVALFLAYASNWVLQQWGESSPPQTMVEVVRAQRHSVLDMLLFGGVAVLLAPVAEEILFRGLLYATFRQIGLRAVALFGSSLLFAAVHERLVFMLPLVSLALILALLYEKTGNLLAPITAHALFNLFTLMSVIFGESFG